MWLPYALIEVAFRNMIDRIICGVHPDAADWLFASGRQGDVLRVADVAAPAQFHASRDDGSNHDPVLDAARTAGRVLASEEITRDDVIAHLMLGFWVNRCADGLGSQGYNMYDLVAAELPPPLDDPLQLRKTMRDHILWTRNRVAHHEPLLFKKKHLFHKGVARNERDLIVAVLEGAFPNFRKEVSIAVETARVMVPQAGAQLDRIVADVEESLLPFDDRLAAIRERMRAERRERIAAERRAKGIEG